jgi:hypothetical protein
MLMYATTSVIVGLAILLLGLAYTKLLASPPAFAQPRVVILSAAAWAGQCLRGRALSCVNSHWSQELELPAVEQQDAADEAWPGWSFAADLGVMRT